MASALWQFWIVSILAATVIAGTSLSNALTTDLVPKQLVGKGLALTNSANWLGAVIGFALTGYAIEVLGVHTAFLWLFILIPIAVLLVTRIRQDGEQARQEGSSGQKKEAIQAPS